MSIHAYVHPLPPLFYNYSSSHTLQLHLSDFTRVQKVSYFHPFIVIQIHLPALKYLNIQKIFFMKGIALSNYYFRIAKVVVKSFTKFVYK